MALHVILQKHLNSAKAQYAEAHGGPDEVAVASQVEALENRFVNLRDVILRQQSIVGLWKKPSAAYVRKLAEIEDLEAKLASF
jgi:hypothetical protein